MNRFVLKITFIKVYIYHFSINNFIETRSQSCVLETVSLSKTTSFTSTDGVLVTILWDEGSTYYGPSLHKPHRFWYMTHNARYHVPKVLKNHTGGHFDFYLPHFGV